jgi:tetratricopeptide (TPR) repeat protein
LAIRAEKALRLVLNADPQRYDARRMLATVLLSQHRFREAIAEAQRCQQVRPTDGWLFGVAGDAHLELGEYEEAFAAFARMDALHPDAASYARLSYARELQGDLAGAVAAMTMALEATSPSDPESQAWHHAQLGHLRLAQDRSAEAAREFEHALYIFPDHPLAIEGLVRVASRQGRHDDAVALAERLIAQAPSPAALALSADELRAAGRTAEATRRDALAEAAWRTDAPEPARLALFLAQRGDKEKIDEAVRLAETAARERNDIFTNDALAWAYFKAGRLEDAARASARALRTGTVDRDLRARAAVIAHADALGER